MVQVDLPNHCSSITAADPFISCIDQEEQTVV